MESALNQERGRLLRAGACLARWLRQGDDWDHICRCFLFVTPWLHVLQLGFTILFVLPDYFRSFEALQATLPSATYYLLDVSRCWPAIVGLALGDVLLFLKEGRSWFDAATSRVVNLLWFLIALAIPLWILAALYLPVFLMHDRIDS